jgi:FKBP-type peptidyl-prolyl cis-trans isomerases 2
MAVQKGDKVAIHYIGRLKDGKEFDNSYENGEPIKFEVGGGMVIPGFDEGVIGMEIGDKKTIVIPPEQAYGERMEEYVFDVSKSEFPKDADIHEGAIFQMQSDQGEVIPVVISKIEGDTVYLDANHPLAGKELTFEMELVATGVEIPHHHCGCGCEECGDDCDCDDHDCDDHDCNCGCGHHH